VSTRGCIGMVADGHIKVVYNHSDSYPAGLGQRIGEFIAQVNAHGSWRQVLSRVRTLRMVEAHDSPTFDECAHLLRYADFRVGGKTSNWECILRRTEGDIEAILSCQAAVDALTFPLSSRWCEWAYVLDLDRMALEVHLGGIYEPHTRGRFADGTHGSAEPLASSRAEDFDWPVMLIAECPLDLISSPAFAQQLMEQVGALGREIIDRQWPAWLARYEAEETQRVG
jgi:hypothetical protein